MNRLPNILFYFGGFSPMGGIETFCKTLLCYLRERNYTCSLLCWGQNSSLIKAIDRSRVNILRTPWRWGCKWHLPEWLLLLISPKKVRNCDIVLFGKLIPYSILKILRRLAKQKTLFVYITPYKPSIPDSEKDRKLLAKTLNLFDVALVQADNFKDSLYSIGYSGRMAVLPYISDKGTSGEVKEFEPLDATQPLKIGFLGRLVEDKNVPALLEAVQNLIKEPSLELSRPIHLCLFGDGCLRSRLEQAAEKLGIDKFVTFFGSVPNDEVEAAISSCHLFVFTSHVEGQCLAALEILSCGRPIVATEVGAFPDILSDSRLGRIVSEASPKLVATSISDIASEIEQKTITPEIVRSAYMERYALDHVGSRYMELLNTLQ